MTERWHGEHIARALLYSEADVQFLDGAYEVAARLYYDVQHARGVVSRRAFSRSIRAAKVNPVRVDALLRALDRDVKQFEELADRVGAAARRRALGSHGLSPIERMVDEATGASRRGK